MEVDLVMLPVKAQSKRRKKHIRGILRCADNMLYSIVQINYPSGLIKFESLQHDNLFINFYATSFTVTIENREEGERNNQYHHRNLYYERVKRIFKNPKKFIT